LTARAGPGGRPLPIELADVQLHLAQRWGLSCTSDYHHFKTTPPPPPRFQTGEAVPYLEKLAFDAGYRCTLFADRMLWRNGRGALDSLGEVPARIEDAWRGRLATGRPLDWEHLGQMAALSERQVEAVNEEFPFVRHVQRLQAVVGWAGRLRPAERRQAEALPRGLPLLRANQAARDWLLHGTDRDLVPGRAAWEPATISIRLQIEEDATEWSHWLHVYRANALAFETRLRVPKPVPAPARD